MLNLVHQKRKRNLSETMRKLKCQHLKIPQMYSHLIKNKIYPLIIKNFEYLDFIKKNVCHTNFLFSNIENLGYFEPSLVFLIFCR